MDIFLFLCSTFCLTDRESKCIAVNLYNLAPGKGVIIGDIVAIPEPHFSKVSLEIKDHQVSFQHLKKSKRSAELNSSSMLQAVAFDLIRVESPLALIINGKKASADFQAGIELSTFAKSD